jgi:NosL protein
MGIMGIVKGSLTALAIAMFLLSGLAAAEECGSDNARIDDANRKFSVVLQKVSGMEDQSFDDIGCAVVSRNNECATRQGMFDGNAVTYDYATGERVPVEKACFVLRTDVKTPRGYGIVAFRDKQQAETFSAAHGKGTVVKWYQLVDEKLK